MPIEHKARKKGLTPEEKRIEEFLYEVRGPLNEMLDRLRRVAADLIELDPDSKTPPTRKRDK